MRFFCSSIMVIVSAAGAVGAAAAEPTVFSRHFVVNGSFEQGFRHWHRIWGRVAITTEVRREGKASLVIRDGGALSTPLMRYSPGILRYSGWIKTRDIIPGDHPWNVANVQITIYDADKKGLRHWDIAATSGTTDWHHFEGNLDLRRQKKAVYLRLTCQIWNAKGEAWFDGIRFGSVYDGPDPASHRAVAIRDANAFPAPVSRPVIIPAPQELERLSGEFVFDTRNPVLIAEASAEAARAGLDIWREDLEQCCALTPETGVWKDGWRKRAIHFGSSRRILQTLEHRPATNLRPVDSDAFAAPETWRRPLPPEGYMLLVLPDAVFLGADDRAGFLHGVQTLSQLLQPVRLGVARLACARVRDWPDLAWRGMYLSMCYGPGAGSGCDVDLLKRMVRNLVGGYKLNKLVLQVDNTMRYRSHPELGGSLEAADMKDLVAYCNRCGVEVIPLIQSFGHNHYFVFGGGKLHRELAEDDTTYSVCPNQPGSVQIFRDIYAEIIEACTPKSLHIGCDEVGPIGVCERCKNTPKAELFAKHVNALRDVLHDYGVTTMIWGDYLLDPDRFPGSSYCHGKDTWEALKLLKKDIVVCDWHYKTGVGPQHEYPTTKALHEAGFTTIGTPAVYSRLNNATYADYVRRIGLSALLGSVWTSVHHWQGIKGVPAYFGGMVYAAEYAWTTRHPSYTKPSPYDAVTLALDRVRPYAPRGADGFFVSLRDSVNAALETGEDFPFGRHRLHGVRFRLLDPLDTGGAWCIGVGEPPSRPAAVTNIPVGEKAVSLAFLHTLRLPDGASAPKPWTRLGAYEIVYADNSVERLDIVSALNVAPFRQARSAPLYGARPVPTGAQGTWYLAEWINPHPDRVIHHLNMLSHPGTHVDLFLGAVTGIGKRANPAARHADAVPGTAPLWVEGFARLISATHQDGYFTYRGISVPSGYEYATDGTESVAWQSEALPADIETEAVTFVLACGLGSGAGDAPHHLRLNGRDLLTIGTPAATDAEWKGPRAHALFDFVTKDRWDSFGVLYLTVPADLLTPGQPVTFEMRGSESKVKSWFMVHELRDTISTNLLHHGRGLMGPSTLDKTP